MIQAYEINLLIYNIAIYPVIFFSLIFYFLAFSNLVIKTKKQKFKNNIGKWPFVSVQIPVFNDPIAARLIKKCLGFNYPKNRYEILVADDSTDEKTKMIIDQFKDKVKIVRRNNREGYKAGALNNLLNYTRGKIIVVFDSDFAPGKNFLKRIVTPMTSDDRIAIVQSRMGYINPNLNFISRFSAFLLMVFHNCVMPISQRVGTVFFCGTGGAIRKDVLLKLGKWNEKNLTEDAELSLRILNAGYKSVYLPNLRSPGELPYTLKGFTKQQMRWVYGLTRAFMDNWKTIFFGKNFSVPQKTMLTLLTMGQMSAPFVFIMALTGQLGWILGTVPGVFKFTIQDAIRFSLVMIATAGFLSLGNLAFRAEKRKYKLRHFIIGSLTLGVVLSLTNSIAFFKAIFNKPMIWIKTPKWGNIAILRFFRNLFSEFL